MKLFVCTLVTMVVIAMLIDDSDAYLYKRREGLEEEERSLQDELDQKLDARELEGLEEEVRSLLDGLKEKLDARELEGLEEEDCKKSNLLLLITFMTSVETPGGDASSCNLQPTGRPEDRSVQWRQKGGIKR
ncbi:Hypp625 [Branchiostoma lanceolatum]|uniref:Hypp625 protein n=1 Tax=Branchiostoma lanceolatum TaxID=7740 RepID=A0A8J9VVT8_BRALA|nr:Hypp625 [Branchiostoma lanceolatum]